MGDDAIQGKESGGHEQMHLFGPDLEALSGRVDALRRELLADPDPSLGGTLTEEALRERLGETITEEGLGTEESLRIFTETLLPACVSTAHPRFLGFIPGAPTEAAKLFDSLLAATGICADWWMEASGAVFAENEALRWIADLLGWPPGAGGVFVSGGTSGNLSALAVGRDVWRRRAGPGREARPAIAASGGGHSSISLAARVLDAEVIDVTTDERGRILGPALREALERTEHDVFAVAATAGTTNLGAIDDLEAVADVCEERGMWMHVDGAYGGAALAVPSARPMFAGVERADSFVVDPHKWLFSPYDCAALLYRDPELARRAFTQTAEYIDFVEERSEWNPSDYAAHLSRRPRGLPFWFSLAANGSRAYSAAVERGLALAHRAAELISAHPDLELVGEPQLSVVLFRRTGWGSGDYREWSDRALREGLTMTAPTSWRGETLLRFCFVNPMTTEDDIGAVLDSLR
ncbi:MAG: aminotransferase class V-fold PLP-dependent enzyme [Solirubrobacterales bacterium]